MFPDTWRWPGRRNYRDGTGPSRSLAGAGLRACGSEPEGQLNYGYDTWQQYIETARGLGRYCTEIHFGTTKVQSRRISLCDARRKVSVRLDRRRPQFTLQALPF